MLTDYYYKYVKYQNLVGWASQYDIPNESEDGLLVKLLIGNDIDDIHLLTLLSHNGIKRHLAGF